MCSKHALLGGYWYFSSGLILSQNYRMAERKANTAAVQIFSLGGNPFCKASSWRLQTHAAKKFCSPPLSHLIMIQIGKEPAQTARALSFSLFWKGKRQRLPTANPQVFQPFQFQRMAWAQLCIGSQLHAALQFPNFLWQALQNQSMPQMQLVHNIQFM